MKRNVMFIREDEIKVKSFGQEESSGTTINCYSDHPYNLSFDLIEKPTMEELEKYEEYLEDQLLLVRTKKEELEKQDIENEKYFKERFSEEKYQEYLNRAGGIFNQ